MSVPSRNEFLYTESFESLMNSNNNQLGGNSIDLFMSGGRSKPSPGDPLHKEAIEYLKNVLNLPELDARAYKSIAYRTIKEQFPEIKHFERAQKMLDLVKSKSFIKDFKNKLEDTKKILENLDSEKEKRNSETKSEPKEQAGGYYSETSVMQNYTDSRTNQPYYQEYMQAKNQYLQTRLVQQRGGAAIFDTVSNVATAAGNAISNTFKSFTTPPAPGNTAVDSNIVPTASTVPPASVRLSSYTPLGSSSTGENIPEESQTVDEFFSNNQTTRNETTGSGFYSSLPSSSILPAQTATTGSGFYSSLPSSSILPAQTATASGLPSMESTQPVTASGLSGYSSISNNYGSATLPSMGSTQPATASGLSGYPSISNNYGSATLPSMGSTQPATASGLSGYPSTNYGSATLPSMGSTQPATATLPSMRTIPAQSTIASATLPSMRTIPAQSTTANSINWLTSSQPVAASAVPTRASTMPVESETMSATRSATRSAVPVAASAVPTRVSTMPVESETMSATRAASRSAVPVAASTVPVAASAVPTRASTMPVESETMSATRAATRSAVPVAASSVPTRASTMPVESETMRAATRSAVPVAASSVPVAASAVPTRESIMPVESEAMSATRAATRSAVPVTANPEIISSDSESTSASSIFSESEPMSAAPTRETTRFEAPVIPSVVPSHNAFESSSVYAGPVLSSSGSRSVSSETLNTDKELYLKFFHEQVKALQGEIARLESSESE
jgi:hypothetical protein